MIIPRMVLKRFSAQLHLIFAFRPTKILSIWVAHVKIAIFSFVDAPEYDPRLEEGRLAGERTWKL